MEPFLKSVANYLKRNYGNELHTLVVVFPNKRTRLFFNKYLSESSTTPVFAPKYYTITEYMQEISGETIADQLMLLFLLYETYVSVTNSKESFDDFLFYCEMLLADFDDIDKYLANAKMVYQNLADLKDINDYFEYLDELQVKAILQFWETFNIAKNSEEKMKFGNLWKVLFTIYEKFNSRLSEKGLCYEGMAYRKAIESIEKNRTGIPGELVVFVGFNALNKCEDKLFGILKKQGKGLFFWDYDDYYIKRKLFHKAAFFLSDFIKKFPAPQGFSFQSNLADTEKRITIVDIPTKIGQAKLLSQVMVNISENWKDNPVKTAVALADESLLLPVLTSLPDNIGEVNVSMGYPLKETLVFSLISTLVELQRNKRIADDKNEQFYHEDVKKILLQGLISSPGKDAINKLIDQFNKSNRIYIEKKLLVLENNVFDLIFRSGIAATNFVPYLIEVLDVIGKQLSSFDGRAFVVEKEAVIRIISQLRRISDVLNETHIEYSFVSLTRLIEKLLKSTTIPFNGEPLKGVQIMGILETRALDFENLIVLSMNEGVFPKAGNVPSFIPYTLRNAFNLPTIEHQDAIFAYYFYRLLQRAKNIVLVYCSSVSDKESGEPSRFIQQLVFDDTFNTIRKTMVYKVYPHPEQTINAIKNRETQSILTSKYSGENSKSLSPSAINTYLNCNLRFYYRYVAGIPEPDPILETVESNTLGSILHKTMQLLYTPLFERISTKSDFERILADKKLIEKSVTKAFFEEYLEPGKEYEEKIKFEYQGSNIIAHEVVLKYIENIIRYDSDHAPIEITGLEKPFAHEFTLTNGTKISVGGIVDRIEQTESSLCIVDYKTGKVKNSFNSIEELFSNEEKDRSDAVFQTLLYSLIVSYNAPGKAIQPNLFYVREITKNAFDSRIKMGNNRSKTYLNSIDTVIAEFEERILNTLENIFAEVGEFNPTLNEKLCQYCPYKTICGK